MHQAPFYKICLPTPPLEFIRFRYSNEKNGSCNLIKDINKKNILINVSPISPMQRSLNVNISLFVFVVHSDSDTLHHAISLSSDDRPEPFLKLQGKVLESIALPPKTSVNIIPSKDYDRYWEQLYTEYCSEPHKFPFPVNAQKSEGDISKMRLAFKAIVDDSFWTEPVISKPISDKRRNKELCIFKIKPNSSAVKGGEELWLLVDEIKKSETVDVMFQDSDNGFHEKAQYIENYGAKSCLIVKIPSFNPKKKVQLPHDVNIYLKNSQGQTSAPVLFKFFEDIDYSFEYKRKRPSRMTNPVAINESSDIDAFRFSTRELTQDNVQRIEASASAPIYDRQERFDDFNFDDLMEPIPNLMRMPLHDLIFIGEDNWGEEGEDEIG